MRARPAFHRYLLHPWVNIWVAHAVRQKTLGKFELLEEGRDDQMNIAVIPNHLQYMKSPHNILRGHNHTPLFSCCRERWTQFSFVPLTFSLCLVLLWQMSTVMGWTVFPQNLDIEILTPNTLEQNLIWKWVNCGKLTLWPKELGKMTTRKITQCSLTPLYCELCMGEQIMFQGTLKFLKCKVWCSSVHF